MSETTPVAEALPQRQTSKAIALQAMCLIQNIRHQGVSQNVWQIVLGIVRALPSHMVRHNLDLSGTPQTEGQLDEKIDEIRRRLEIYTVAYGEPD
jgi:hypothetical protein